MDISSINDTNIVVFSCLDAWSGGAQADSLWDVPAPSEAPAYQAQVDKLKKVQ